MLKKIREMKDQDGFTLIELMVVVLIIAILIAIAIPTFLGLRQRAQDRAAQSDLRNALTGAKAFYTDGETFVGFLAAAPGIEPSLTWGAAGSKTTVGVTEMDADTVTVTKQSESNSWFCGYEDAGNGAVHGPGAAEANVDSAAECKLLAKV
jgi:type IV pilus assembly protein PilA